MNANSNSIPSSYWPACNERSALALALNSANSATVPDWILLIPAGTVVGVDGRSWVNDQPNHVVTLFNQRQLDVPIDWEHATEVRAPKGLDAPAAGWCRALEVREGAVWGRVEWTAAGVNCISSKSYRYYSPVFLFDKALLRIVRLVSVGLTNTPNLHLALNRQQDDYMDPELLRLLGLAENASAADVLTAVKKLIDATNTDSAVNRSAVPIPPALDLYVPRPDYDQALRRAENAEQRARSLEQSQQNNEIEHVILQALASGRITPATADYHRAQCRSEGGLARFQAFVRLVPEIVPSSVAPSTAPTTAVALNHEEREAARLLGMSDAEFVNAKGNH